MWQVSLDRQFVQIQSVDVASINRVPADKVIVRDRYAAYATPDTSTVFPASVRNTQTRRQAHYGRSHKRMSHELTAYWKRRLTRTPPLTARSPVDLEQLWHFALVRSSGSRGAATGVKKS